MYKKIVCFLVFAFVLSSAFAVQAASVKTPAQLVEEARASIKEVSVEDLENMIDNDEDVIILDIRDPNEYEVSHIAGAKHMSRGLMDLHIQEIIPDKNAKIVVY
jgi:predicted sulfurtransferase